MSLFSIFGKPRELRSQVGSLSDSDFSSLSAEITDLTKLIDAESILLAVDDSIVFVTEGIETYKLIRDQRIINQELINLVRAARRSRKVQEVTMELPRGPLGAGTHDLFVRISLIGDAGILSILIFDDSEMRRLDSIRRDFVANISHELKTPIGALSILSEAVLGAADDPEAIKRFATRMQAESSRLAGLVQEIINLSRLQDDDPLQRANDFLVETVINEAREQSRLNAEARQVEIYYQSLGTLSIKGDRDQVVMAIHNLIENAINYSPNGTRVAITSKEVDGLCQIVIADQGIGIPERDLERIFERFYRVDPARSRLTGGTGLGLSIVKHVVSNHGGDISVWSVEGAGSSFTIRLPLFTKTEEKI